MRTLILESMFGLALPAVAEALEEAMRGDY